MKSKKFHIGYWYTHWKNKSKGFKFFTLSLIIVPLVISYYVFLYQVFPFRPLNLPKDKDLLIDFNWGVIIYENASNLRPNKTQYQFYGRLRGKRQPIEGVFATYDFLFDRLKITKAPDILIMNFERRSDSSNYYQTDSRLSSQERLAIFRTFDMDWTNELISEDHSLFQRPIRMVISPIAKLESIRLSSSLKKKLVDTAQTFVGNALIAEFIYNTAAIPSIFPQKKKYKNSWLTSGKFLSDIDFQHQLKETKENKKTFQTQIITHAVPSLSSTNKGWYIKTGSFDWIYDVDQKWIDQLMLNFIFEQQQRNSNLFSSKSITITGQFKFLFDQKISTSSSNQHE